MVGRCYVTGDGMEMQSVWKDCSKFDGLLVMIPPCGVQLPQLTCNPCNSNAIRWIAWNLQFHHNPQDFKILSQFNSIVKIAVRIAVLPFCVGCAPVQFGRVYGKRLRF